MSIIELWLPILVSAAFVWVISALVWMVFPWHKSDFAPTRDEEAVRAALKGLQPGYYNLPHCTDMKQLKEPEMQRKFDDGPLAFITIVPNGVPNMGAKLIGTIGYYILIGVICAYMVSRTAAADATYLQVFRIAGTTAFVAHGVAFIQDTIWFGRPVSITAKSLLDAFLYGLVTGGVFGWLT